MQGNRNALYDFLLKNIVWGMLDKQVHSGSKEKTKISAFNWNAPETGNWYQILYLQIVVPEITPKYPFIFSTFCRFIFLTLLGILILSFPFSGQENRAK